MPIVQNDSLCSEDVFERTEQDIFDSSISCIHFSISRIQFAMGRVLVSHEISTSNTQTTPKSHTPLQIHSAFRSLTKWNPPSNTLQPRQFVCMYRLNNPNE